LLELVRDLKMTSDEAPEPALNLFQGGGGMRYALPALLQMPALNLFQGRLLLPGFAAFQRKGLFTPGKEKTMKGFLAVMVVLFAFGAGLAHAQPLPPSQAGAAADSVKKYKPCPKCGVANLPEARFCYSCGAAFEAGAVPAVLPESARADTSRAGVCPVCGTVRIPEAQFCSHCGARFTETSNPGWPRKIESGPKKQPVVAFGLSLVLPGAGQFYNGQPVKGAIFFGSYLTGWGLFIEGFRKTLSNMDSDNAGNSLSWVGFVVGGVSWVGSVIDAPASAHNINRRRGYSALTSPGVGLVFVPDPRNPRSLKPGVGLRAGF